MASSLVIPMPRLTGSNSRAIKADLQEAHDGAEGTAQRLRGVWHGQLPLEVDAAIREDTEQPEEAVGAGDKEGGVPGLAAHPRPVGDGGQQAARRHHHALGTLQLAREHVQGKQVHRALRWATHRTHN